MIERRNAGTTETLPRPDSRFPFPVSDAAALLLSLSLLLAAASTARAGQPAEEVFLHTCPEIASRLALLDEVRPDSPLEKVFEILDGLLEDIRGKGTSFAAGAGGRPQEVLRELRSRFLRLPPAVQAAYLAQAGSPAALEGKDLGSRPDALADLFLRHPLSPVAVQAARLLARRACESGDCLGALRWLREASPAGGVDPADAPLAAFCWARLGWFEKAAALEPGGAGRAEVGPRLSRGPLPGAGFLPVPARAFALRPPDLPGEALFAGGPPPPVPYRPVLNGGALYLPTRRGLEKVEAATGRLLWRFPDDPEGAALGSLRGLLLQPVLSGGKVALSFGSHLAAFDARTGKMLWDFGDPEAVPPPPGGNPAARAGLPPAASLSVPVPLGDDWLAAMTSVRGATECFLLRLGPDGAIRWRLFVASGPAARRLGRVPQPRLAVDGAVAYVSTGTGACAAVALEGPRFLWGRAGDPLPPFAPAAAGLLEAQGAAPRPSPIVFASPLVYVLPEEQGVLLALDAVDGELAWSFRVPPAGALAGVGEGRVLVCGRSEAAGLDRWTGELLWSRALPGPAGGAALAGGRALVSLPDALLVLDPGDGSEAARVELPAGRPPGFGLSTSEGLLAAGWAGAILLEDASAPGAGRRLHFAGRAASGRFREAAALLGPGPGGDIPAEDLAAAARRAAEAGRTVEAAAFLEAAGRSPGADPAAAARALLAVGRAEAEAGRPESALSWYRRVLALPDAPVEDEDGAPWPSSALARAALRALLEDPAAREAWEREAREALAKAGAGGARDFLRQHPFSAAFDAALLRDAGAPTPERSALLWREGARRLPEGGEILEALAAALRATAPTESDQVHLLLGRPAGEAAFLRAPALAGPELEKAWHAPARVGASFAVVPRFLPRGRCGEPALFAGGAEFIERLDPRFGWTLWRRGLGTWWKEAAWAEGVLVVGCLSAIRGLDPATGKDVWAAPLKAEESLEEYRLVPGRKRVAAVFRKGRAAGFEATTGKRAWESEGGGGSLVAVDQDPVSGRAGAYLSGGSRFLLDPDAGPVPTGRRSFRGAPFAAGGGCVLFLDAGPDETEATLAEAATGKAIWSRTVPAPCRSALVAASEGVAILLPAPAPAPDRPVYGLGLAEGEIRWQQPVPVLDARGWVANGRLLLWTRGLTLRAIAVGTGAAMWAAPLGGAGAIPAATAVTGRAVAVGTTEGFLLLDPETGRRAGSAGKIAPELGRVSSVSPAGAEGFLVFAERGTALFSGRVDAAEWFPGRGAPPLEGALLASELQRRRAGPWGGVPVLERRLRRGEAIERGGGDAEFLALRGAVEAAAFRRPLALRAARFAVAPRIDGELDDPWPEADAVRLALGAVRFLPGAGGRPWRGEADASAVLYAGWDDHALYLALDLRDDVKLPHDQGETSWKGDAVVLAVDRFGDGGFRQGVDDSIFWMATMAPRPEGEPERGGERILEQQNLAIRPRPGGSGAVYEVALPWEEFFNRHLRQAGLRRGLIAPARPGLRFGLNVLAIDDDGEGPGHYLALAPGLELEATKWASFREGVWPQLWARVELR